MSHPPVLFDRQLSALQQMPQTVAAHPVEVWSGPLAGAASRSVEERELATLMLAANLELIGYSPEHAWLFAEREVSGKPGHLDG